MTRASTALAIIVVAATAAAAQSTPNGTNYKPDKRADRQVVPPEYYDKPYYGNLTVTRVATEKAVTAVCPKTPFPYKLGCSFQVAPQAKDGTWAGCRVIVVADDVIAAAGYTTEIVYRHEMGHCNGWPGDHWGARYAPMPEAKEEQKELNWLNLPASVKRGLELGAESVRRNRAK